MAYRVRGRGHGYRGGGGGRGYAKQEPFICFPDAELPDIKGVTVEENLVRRSLKLHNFWKASPYYIEETNSKKGQSTEIEKFSDRNKVSTTIRRDSLSQILEHRSFPMELTEGSKGWQRQPSQKRVRWNPDSELRKLDLFEKLEQRENNKGGKEKKEGEDEDEDEDQENEESEEEPSDADDYNQNVDFDDDEDDFNVEDDGEDEMTY